MHKFERCKGSSCKKGKPKNPGVNQCLEGTMQRVTDVQILRDSSFSAFPSRVSDTKTLPMESFGEAVSPKEPV